VGGVLFVYAADACGEREGDGKCDRDGIVVVVVVVVVVGATACPHALCGRVAGGGGGGGPGD